MLSIGYFNLANKEIYDKFSNYKRKRDRRKKGFSYHVMKTSQQGNFGKSTRRVAAADDAA